MTLHTRLTERLALEHPVLSAPMAFVAGGRWRLRCRAPAAWA